MLRRLVLIVLLAAVGMALGCGGSSAPETTVHMKTGRMQKMQPTDAAK